MKCDWYELEDLEFPLEVQSVLAKHIGRWCGTHRADIIAWASGVTRTVCHEYAATT